MLGVNERAELKSITCKQYVWGAQVIWVLTDNQESMHKKLALRMSQYSSESHK